uniref:Ribosome biogenesis protein BOP1 homolog n=1 Tax=Phallusia mammillata TaxID=59560 RepID=A0A6F9D8H2_9ASCI|nr:ribosome biogenesis protein bop1-A-like [Phallusia mammillata]
MKAKKRQFLEENTSLSLNQESLFPSKGKLDVDDEDSSDESVVESSDEEVLEKETEAKSAQTIEKPYSSDVDDDVSDDEDLRNTVGNIPMEWYENFPHIGYDLDGRTISKPIRNQDELDKFLDKMENKNYWRTVHDKQTGRDHVLTSEELQLIQRLKKGSFYTSGIDPHEPYVDFFTHEKMIHPVTNIPEHKRSFTPSIIEKRKVGKLVHAIKMGWLKPRKPKTDESEEPKFYDLWEETESKTPTNSELARQKMAIPAPKTQLPGHEASYNPPPEYLPSQEEIDKWKEDDEDERKLDFIPEKFDSLRQVPQYPTFIQERFSRCLDLYLCPRQRKMKVMVNPEELIPNLPKPKDLQPFPTFQALCYKGHKAMVRTISVDSTGQWLASGSDDGIIRVWEVATSRCLREITTLGDQPVKCVSWCPNKSVCLLAVALENKIVIINPSIGDKLIYSATDSLLQSFQPLADEETTNKQESEKSNAVIPPWKTVETGLPYQDGQRLVITHPKDVSKVTWHAKGDYLACVVPGNGHAQVFLHQLTKQRSQTPFTKCKGAVQSVLFHPTRPFLFVATQQYVRVYNLVKQQLTKKLMANSKWISSLAIHPGGDNLLVGSYDCRLSWFDMDLSTKPYKTMRYHKRAIRSCCYHPKYPLFASGGDDGNVVVSHGMVYSDLMQNPLIVPVKVLKGHKVERNLGVLDCCFHPHQPWIFSSAADKTIRLFT